MRSDSDLEKRMVEYIEDNGVHCPFCGFTGMERENDATDAQIGILKQRRTCWKCFEIWTIEYQMVRIKHSTKMFDKLGEIKKSLKGRDGALYRLLRYAKSLDW